MIKGGYSVQNQALRAVNLNYAHATVDQLFTQQKEKKTHESMSPFGIKFRESLDTEDHPNVFPVLFAADVTGSQYNIPVYLVREGLLKLMTKVLEAGGQDVQLLFMGVGDHYSDDSPIQIGQFESTDELVEQWPKRLHLEGNGGGNGGESYHLPWYFAANHTSTDQWNKRHKKGLLFTTGDENCHSNLEKEYVSALFGPTAVLPVEKSSYTMQELLQAAQEKYEVYHILTTGGAHGTQFQGYWNELLGDHCIPVSDDHDIPNLVAEIIGKKYREAVQDAEVISITTAEPETNYETTPSKNAEEVNML